LLLIKRSLAASLYLLCDTPPPIQLKDLQATIAAVPCDAVLLGTPHDITQLIPVPQPLAVVTYKVVELDSSVGDGIMSLAGDDGTAVCAVTARPADVAPLDAARAVKEKQAANSGLQECLEKFMQQMK